jgi:hypothetical protein
VFIEGNLPHLVFNERQTLEARKMHNSHIFTRSLSLIMTGITATVLFMLAISPSASLFAG